LATGLNIGGTNISATLLGVTATTKLTVSDAVLKKITISPSNETIANGTWLQYIAMGEYGDGTLRDITSKVTWSSSDAKIAIIYNAATNKGFTKAMGIGKVEIKATLEDKSVTTSLTVSAALLTKITIDPANGVAAKGTSLQFKAQGSYSDGSTQDLTKEVTWNSDKAPVAIISNDPASAGLASAKDKGHTNISANYKNKTAQATLTVTDALLETIVVTPASASVAIGATQQYQAQGSFTDGMKQDLTKQVVWSSDQPGVAIISNVVGSEGLASGVAVGSCQLTAVFGKVTGKAALTVTATP
jgi:hypothetical protein